MTALAPTGLDLLTDASPWRVVTKFNAAGARLADRHYTRRTIGSRQFMPPGETLVLLARDETAVFGWHRPHPPIRRMDGLDGWCCSIFRNEGAIRSSALILAAERLLRELRSHCGPDGLFTYVEPGKLRPNRQAGYCFLRAGWQDEPERWSADGRKRLLWKRWADAGWADAEC